MNSLKATCTTYLIGSKGNRRARWQFSLKSEAACKSKEKSNEHVKIVDRGKWQLLGSRVLYVDLILMVSVISLMTVGEL